MDNKNNPKVNDTIRTLSAFSVDDLRRLNKAITERLNKHAQDKKEASLR